MSNEKNVHVVPHEGGWATRRPNSGRVSRTFDTQFAVFDLRHDFPNEWYKAMQVPAGATERVIAIDTLLDRLPIFTKNTLPTKILAKDVYLFTPTTFSAADLKLVQGMDEPPFAESPAVGEKMKSFHVEVDCQLTGWTISIADVKSKVDQLWLVVRYTLGA